MKVAALLDCPRAALALVAAFALLAIALALALQYGLDLAPCPLCALQRLALIVAGAVAAAGALLAHGRGWQLGFLGASTLAALAGASVAAWHVRILAAPVGSFSCGRPFQWLHEDFPLAVWLPRLFHGYGDCLSNEWTLLGLGVPHWSLAGFAIVLALLALGFRGALRARR